MASALACFDGRRRDDEVVRWWRRGGACLLALMDEGVTTRWCLLRLDMLVVLQLHTCGWETEWLDVWTVRAFSLSFSLD